MKPFKNNNDKGGKRPFDPKDSRGKFGKGKFEEEKKPSVFDRAFQDPDKAKKQRERDELIGPREERVFSKSLDDESNPKYGSNPFAKKMDFTKKEKDKYKERFPQRAARDERGGYGDQKPRFDRDGNEGDSKRAYSPRGDKREGGFDKSDRGYNKDRNASDNRTRGNKPYGRNEDSGDRQYGGNRRTENDRDNKPPYGRNEERGERKYSKDNRGDRRSEGDRSNKSYGRNEDRGERKYGGDSNKSDRRSEGDRSNKPYGRSEGRGERKFGTEGSRGDRSPSGDRNSKPYGNRDERSDRKGSEGRRTEGRSNRVYSKDEERGEGRFGRDGKRPESRPGTDRGNRSFGEREVRRENKFGGEDRRTDKRGTERRERGDSANGGFNKDRGERKPFDKSGKRPEKKNEDKKGGMKFEKFMKPEKEKIEGLDDYKFRTRFTSFDDQNKAYTARKERNSQNKFDGRDEDLENSIQADYNPDAKMPLNKFLSRSGVCSRRDAVDIVKAQRVSVNGEVVVEPGYKVQEMDQVKLDNKIVKITEGFIYVLMNKPKGYITTLDDPKGRRIVSELYQEDIQQRIFPVGRLDRNTTGLLLLTNDGDLSNELAHPKYKIKKIYQVKLDKVVTQPDMQAILNGLELEDGIAQVDQLSYLTSKDEIGIEIHSGKNRIVRRIFEHLGYEVEKLDRVLYAGLTKKNLPKGKWRFLSRQEVINLKHLGKKK